MKKEILNKITKIIEEHDTDNAIIKLNGYLKQYYWNQELRTRLGQLYLKKADFVQAGKLLYFKKDKTEAELRCVKRFQECCGNKRVEEFRSIKKPPKEISIDLSRSIFSLIVGIMDQEGNIPKDIGQWIYHYEIRRNYEIEKGMFDVEK